MATTRNKIVTLAQSYLYVKQGSKQHKKLVDTFNKKSPHGEKGNYTCPWCAISWTAWSILAGMTAKETPMSYNCGTLIEDAKKLGIWVENDNYLPKKGDGVIYDWSDTGTPKENKDGASHVGMVVSVSGNKIKVIEGNYSTTQNVAYRTIKRNQRYIRGFITPKYVSENEQKVHKVANELAHPLGTEKSVYTKKATKDFTKALNEVYPDRSKWGDNPKIGKACDPAVGVVLRKSGVCPKFPRGLNQQIEYEHKNLKPHEKKKVTPYSVIKDLGLDRTLIVQYMNKSGTGHTLIWDKGQFEEASQMFFLKRKNLAKLKKKRAFVRILEII